jgi:hypothetical protein
VCQSLPLRLHVSLPSDDMTLCPVPATLCSLPSTPCLLPCRRLSTPVELLDNKVWRWGVGGGGWGGGGNGGPPAPDEHPWHGPRLVWPPMDPPASPPCPPPPPPSARQLAHTERVALHRAVRHGSGVRLVQGRGAGGGSSGSSSSSANVALPTPLAAMVAKGVVAVAAGVCHTALLSMRVLTTGPAARAAMEVGLAAHALLSAPVLPYPAVGLLLHLMLSWR